MATASSLKNQLVKREVVGQTPAIANSVKARVDIGHGLWMQI